MRDIATAAKCASSCDGVCNTAEIGCLRGLPEWQRHVERKLQASSATQQQSNGVEEIEDAKEIGGSHCTRCAVGQGRDCECRSKPMSLDRFALRIVLGGLALFWGLAIGAALLRGCAS